MPYKDPEIQKTYQREWIRKRREKYTAGFCCIDCGSKEKIHIDHVDPSKKLDHRIWSWSEKRLLEELNKCVPRCENCHTERHAKEMRVDHHGLTMYENHGCRCKTCKKAKAIKNLRTRVNRGEASQESLDLLLKH